MKALIKYFIAGLILGLFPFAFIVYYQNPLYDRPCIQRLPITPIENELYTVKQFDITDNTQGLSKNQIDQHKELYAGYIKKRNEIAQKLQTVNREYAANRTYSAFRALKIAETYAINGSLLHELYFENLGGNNTTMGPMAKKLLEKNFGSLDSYKQDFIDCGGCARGWVITALMLDDYSVHNFVLEEHNQHVPVLALPLIVLDVYEHAYMIDFGIKRDPYLEVFWKNINWNVVEKRIQKWQTNHFNSR